MINDFVKKSFSLRNFLELTGIAAQRFPVAAIAALLFTLLSLSMTHNLLQPNVTTGKLLLFLPQAALATIALQLLSESKPFGATVKCSLQFNACAIIAATLWVPHDGYSMHIYIAAALAILMLFAPYIRRSCTEDSFWYYNYLNIKLLAAAAGVALIFCLGLSLLVGSVQYLFNLRGIISSKVYADIWVVGWCLLGPIYILSQITRKFDFEKEECAAPKGAFFSINYMCVPLVLAYMLVLYAYLMKIALEWELPRGNLAYLVTGFGLLGILVYLSAYPMLEKGTQLLRWFYKNFFAILIVPVVLLSIGLYARINQYGLTEDRYQLGLLTVWFAGLSLLFTVKRERAHLKHIPMFLCLLFLIGAVGPWSSYAMSTDSQVSRLGALLTKTGILKADGSLKKAEPEIKGVDAAAISSIVNYLNSNYALKKITPWTAPFNVATAQLLCDPQLSFCLKNRDFRQTSNILAAWGVQYNGNSWQQRQARSGDANYKAFNISTFQNTNTEAVRIANYAYMASIPFSGYTEQHPVWRKSMSYDTSGAEPGKLDITYTEDANLLSVTFNDSTPVIFDLQAMAERLQKDGLLASMPMPKEKQGLLTLHAAENGIEAELRIDYMSGGMDNGRLVLGSARMTLFFTPPPAKGAAETLKPPK